MASPRIFQTGAMGLERSTSTKEHGGWGDASSAVDLAGSVAFPWTTFDNALTINTTEDDSVTTNAFPAQNRLVGKFVDLGLGMYDQYKSLGRFFYWYWGFETAPVATLVAKGTLAVNEPTHGDTFTDDDANNYVFLRTEVSRSLNHEPVISYIFRADDGSVPLLQTGLLTNGTSIGDDINMESHSPLMYEHLFELDKFGRQLRDFTTDEQANLTQNGDLFFVTGDKKSLFATFAKKFDTYDMRYYSTMAKGFTLKFSPAEKTTIEGGLLGYLQERSLVKGGFGSGTWTLPCDLGEGQMIPLHWQTSIFVAPQGVDILDTTVEGYVYEEPITDAEVGFEIPLDNVQDTVSGVALAQPLLEGKYSFSASMTISRHVKQDFQNFRDDQTLLKSYYHSVQAWASQEVFVKQFSLSQAGPSDDAIATEPLEMQVGWDCDGAEFGTLLEDGDGNSLEVNNSPILLRTRDESPYCQSTGRDALGVMETF